MSNSISPQLLMTAVVLVRAKSSHFSDGRVLLDTGSTNNFITEAFARKLKAEIKNCNKSISGFGGKQSVALGSVEIVIQSRVNKFQNSLNCLVVPTIIDLIPGEPFPRKVVDFPSQIRLADPRFHVPRSIDVLIGSSGTLSLLSIGQIHVSRDQYDLWFQKTQLGWVVVGGIDQGRDSVASCNVIDLNEQLARFWELEEVGPRLAYTALERACEDHYVANTVRDNTGRYVVRLPFKQADPQLGNSRSRALRQFYALKRRFQANPDLHVEYSKVMLEYLELGHMSLLRDEGQEGYYLPHHAVVKPSSTTTKTRIVFNASAKTDTDVSLNDLLMVGPTVQPKLFNHLIRFRSYAFVVTADIESMYRQILVDPRDRCYQRLFWEYENKLRTFELNTVIFGMSSAPFLAIRTLHQLANDEESDFPHTSRILKRDFYVDDLLTGANSLEEILQVRNELIQLLSRGGFTIRKWASNQKHALDDLDERIFKTDCGIEGSPVIKTLGLLWNSQFDHFSYAVKPIETPKTVTKRFILSEIAKIFDPLGLLGPVIFTAKTIMQECWKAKVSWDESVPQELHTRWVTFADQLNSLEGLSVPRHLILPSSVDIQIHGFCDASERGYGACIYVRSVGNEGQITIRLACSKSRVAPVKLTTIPRLELCAALTLVRLYNECRESFDFSVNKIVFWSDSEIVLQWIKKSPQSLKVFEGNRVAEIQEGSKNAEWRHVTSKENFADILSRGQNPVDLVKNSAWLSGMPWLYKSEENWPRSKGNHDIELPGLRSVACKVGSFVANTLLSKCDPQVSASQNSPSSDIPFHHNFSSYFKLINTIAYSLRWRFREDRKQLALTLVERARAELRLIRLIQKEQFSKEIKELERIGSIKNSRIASLNPFIDPNGILRVGGRLKNSHLPLEQKYPVLLPSHHHVTDLIIREIHNALLHAGVQGTLYNIRHKFWLLDGRNQVRKIVRQCVKCIRYRPVLVQGKMSDLPPFRVQQSAVFEHVGVDYFGPINIKEKKFRNRVVLPAYGCVFICMVTRAVHIEISSDLTTEGFLAAFGRFVGRRGIPSHVYSDNGTNFVGAETQLRQLFDLVSSQSFRDTLSGYTLRHGITWHFNPPLSPHFGGIWEAAVKSFKHHLRRVIGDQLLTFEHLNTLCIQIESILNSRPISPMSTDPNDPAALTPAHFLINRPLTMVPNLDLTSVPENRLSAWRFITKARQDFWKRWHVEYLNELQKRQKWLNSKGEVKVGTVVILIEDNQKCSHWPLGVIVEVFPGSDGVVRVASVKTKSGVYKRNVTQLCPLLEKL